MAVITKVTALVVTIQYFSIHRVGYDTNISRGVDKLLKCEFLAPATTVADWQCWRPVSKYGLPTLYCCALMHSGLFRGALGNGGHV